LKDFSCVDKGKSEPRLFFCTQWTNHVQERFHLLLDAEDKKFEADKARVISEILTLAMKSSS
jgi:hypothetical protein